MSKNILPTAPKRLETVRPIGFKTGTGAGKPAPGSGNFTPITPTPPPDRPATGSSLKTVKEFPRADAAGPVRLFAHPLLFNVIEAAKNYTRSHRLTIQPAGNYWNLYRHEHAPAKSIEIISPRFKSRPV